MSKQYHPASYSVQARELSDRFIENVNSGHYCIEQVIRFFQMGNLHKKNHWNLIEWRALKRFLRAVHMGKAKENTQAKWYWENYKKQTHLKEQEWELQMILEYRGNYNPYTGEIY